MAAEKKKNLCPSKEASYNTLLKIFKIKYLYQIKIAKQIVWFYYNKNNKITWMNPDFWSFKKDIKEIIIGKIAIFYQLKVDVSPPKYNILFSKHVF